MSTYKLSETFLLVVKLDTIRILLSLAANLGWMLHQFDVNNAFLDRDLEEEVYIDIPHGCSMTLKANVVYKFRELCMDSNN